GNGEDRRAPQPPGAGRAARDAAPPFALGQRLYRAARRGRADRRRRDPHDPRRPGRVHSGRHGALLEQPVRRGFRDVRDLCAGRPAVRLHSRGVIAATSMTYPDLLFVPYRDTLDLLTVDDAMAICEEVYRMFARGTVQHSKPPSFKLDAADGFNNHWHVKCV